MSCANSVAAPCARSCARSVLARRGDWYPASLALLWKGKFLTFNGKFLIWRR